MRTTARLVCLFLSMCTLLAGCVRQEPVLTGEATPVPTPTPPPPVVQQSYASEEKTDAMGNHILEAQTHYSQYISFADMRVYEYAAGTFLDATCINKYSEALLAEYEIVFTDAQGTVIANALLVFGDGPASISPGETAVYAQINTDMRVDNLPFSIVVVQQPVPQ